ncbi:MAG: porphobilinogen synthase [Alphaproteobacteria bacterium]
MTLRSYPKTRLRRLRQNPAWRHLVAEHHLAVSDLIMPLFLCDEGEAATIPSFPHIMRYSISALPKKIEHIAKLGIKAIMLFPKIPDRLKTDDGAEALNENNLISQAIKKIKSTQPTMLVIADVALDPYTSHGHDGLIKNNMVLNDETNAILVKQAILLADIGADAVAPSDMMDGRVGMIRQALENKKYHNTIIISYAAKYASCFYGPFRDAVGSSLKGDKKTYQINPANSDEALAKVKMDINEGADVVMIKPALPFLDIIHRVKQQFQMPTFAYQVSGEYAMLASAGENNYLSMDDAMMESLLSIKRSGADAIVCYAADHIAKTLQNI